MLFRSVCAIPIISRPDIITENDLTCIGVGVINPNSSMAFCNDFGRLNCSKVLIVLVIWAKIGI